MQAGEREREAWKKNSQYKNENANLWWNVNYVIRRWQYSALFGNFHVGKTRRHIRAVIWWSFTKMCAEHTCCARCSCAHLLHSFYFATRMSLPEDVFTFTFKTFKMKLIKKLGKWDWIQLVNVCNGTKWMNGRTAKHSPIHQWAQHHFIAIKRRVSQSVNIMFSFVCAWAYCAYGCVRWVKWSDKCTHLVIHMTQTMVIIVFLLLLLLLVLVVSSPSSHIPRAYSHYSISFSGYFLFSEAIAISSVELYDCGSITHRKRRRSRRWKSKRKRDRERRKNSWASILMLFCFVGHNWWTDRVEIILM